MKRRGPRRLPWGILQEKVKTTFIWLENTKRLHLIPKPLQSVLFKSLIVGMLLSSAIIKSIFPWKLCKIHNTPYKILLTFMILHEWYGMELNFNPFMNSKAITKRSIYTILLVCYCLQQSWDLQDIYSWILCKIHNTPYKILTSMICHEWYGVQLTLLCFCTGRGGFRVWCR